MKCKGAEVEFRSEPVAYMFEESGLKNHTERLVTIPEAVWLDKTNVKTIRISKVDDPTLSFTREITHIAQEGEILRHYLYSFTWKHEVRK